MELIGIDKHPRVDLSQFSVYEDVDNWEIYKFEQFYRTKNRSRAAKIKFNITVDDLIYPRFCPILNIPITRKLKRDNFPSIDRVNPKNGYIKGNVKIISHKANRMKQDNTIESLEKFL